MHLILSNYLMLIFIYKFKIRNMGYIHGPFHFLCIPMEKFCSGLFWTGQLPS